MTVTLVQATVATVGREKASQYHDGTYRNIKFRMPDGTEKWKSVDSNSAEMTWIRKGLSCQVSLKDDRISQLYKPDGSEARGTAVNQSASESPQERPQAKDVGDYLEQMTALYAACYRRSQKHLDGAPDAAIQACASSVFISAQRKFDLA